MVGINRTTRVNALVLLSEIVDNTFSEAYCRANISQAKYKARMTYTQGKPVLYVVSFKP